MSFTDSDQYKHIWQNSQHMRLPVSGENSGYLFKRQWSALELIDISPNEQEDYSEYEEVIGEVITILVEYSFVTREESFGGYNNRSTDNSPPCADGYPR